MLKLTEKYNEIFNLEETKGIIKIFNAFMLALPHIIACLVLIIFFPEKWIGIFFVGLILPDLSYFFHMFIYPAALLKGDSFSKRTGKRRKKVAHLSTFIILLLLLVVKEYILFFAGGIHLLLDLMGF